MGQEAAADVHRSAIRIVHDRDRGASAIGADLRRLLVPWTGSAAEGEALAWELIAAKPVMAPVLHIANHLLGGTASQPPPAKQLRDSAGVVDAMNRLRKLLPEGKARLMTYSASGTAEAVLDGLHREGLLSHVYLSEGQPGGEGRAEAARLAAEWGPRGPQIVLTHDAALSSLLPRVDAFLIGADLVLPRGIVNKVGTGPLVERAHREGVPVAIAAGPEKAPPKGVRQAHLPLPLATDRGELSDPPTGVRTVGLLFEWVDIRGRALPPWAADPDVPLATPELLRLLEDLVEENKGTRT